MKYSLPIGALALASTIACTPPSLYDWGNYEGSLYQLMKDPTSLDQYGATLNRQITRAEVDGKVPPGIYAEYGYFLVTTHKPQEAVAWFQKEKAKWPESRILMDKMILTCQSQKAKPTETKPSTDTKTAAQAATGSVQ